MHCIRLPSFIIMLTERAIIPIILKISSYICLLINLEVIAISLSVCLLLDKIENACFASR